MTRFINPTQWRSEPFLTGRGACLCSLGQHHNLWAGASAGSAGLRTVRSRTPLNQINHLVQLTPETPGGTEPPTPGTPLNSSGASHVSASCGVGVGVPHVEHQEVEGGSGGVGKQGYT